MGWNSTAVDPRSCSSSARLKLISIRPVADGANHTSLLKWSIFLKSFGAWMRRQCLRERGLNGKMQIPEWADISILHLISGRNCIFWLDSPISLACWCHAPEPADCQSNLATTKPWMGSRYVVLLVCYCSYCEDFNWSSTEADQREKPALTYCEENVLHSAEDGQRWSLSDCRGSAEC